MTHEAQDWLLWTLLPNFGLIQAHKILPLIDHPADLFNDYEKLPLSNSVKLTLREMQFLGEQHPVRLRALEQHIWQEAENHHLIAIDDARFPLALSQLEDPPLMLWVAGNPDILSEPQVSMVGSRNASASGNRNARKFAGDLADHGITVTSGGARGVDSAAHSGAIQHGGWTIAVLGCGVDVVYPRENGKLFQQIQQQGALVSEYPLGTPPKSGLFPRRNRLISALGQALIVVEASEKSGTLVTVRHALAQGKDIFAIPGDINHPNTTGSNRILQEGAHLLLTAQDVLEVMQIKTNQYTAAASTLPQYEGLSDTQQKIMSVLSNSAIAIDELSFHLSLSSNELIEPLLDLELSGIISQQAGGYVLNPL